MFRMNLVPISTYNSKDSIAIELIKSNLHTILGLVRISKFMNYYKVLLITEICLPCVLNTWTFLKRWEKKFLKIGNLIIN